jgi:hypothetical protein
MLHLGYQRFGVEGLQLTNSRDREPRKVLALRPRLWSHGGEDSHFVNILDVEFS